ncbi:MAG: rRNA (cytidine1920-2-O)/16S rRNA (cytidine1409-2-O)-methyltransferase [Actinomycetota bacterium]|jgi:23S rRNA (cytidine1920-2'-O)/16S rRNA (cytidine1409-2'-O)-methyltransferase|nr:rRNA (cytidine1920-2-O)/16S rRNA (cytidine1409-2-O)-methyltransferase [Actinomycetota bacterium]
MARRRLDAELVRRGLAASRAEAQEAVRRGLVVIGGAVAVKSATLVGEDQPLGFARAPRRFVSRGGGKLQAALDGFGINVAGAHGLDAGASTGGFTDCLLQAGAHHVVAVDVGYGQFDWGLRGDPRVTLLERTNVRDLRDDMLPYRPSLIVADLSFISLKVVLPTLRAIAAPDATFVTLVKPQFEADQAEVGPGGVIRDPAVWRRVLEDAIAASSAAGIRATGLMASPLPGPAGNIEFLLQAGGATADAIPDVNGAIAQAEAIA